MKTQKYLLPLVFLATLLVLVAMLLAQSLPSKFLPGVDSGFFLYAGAQLLKGKLLFVDVWDHKGPGIFWIDALGLWLGHNSRWGVFMLEFLSLAGAFGLGLIALRRLWGNAAALVGLLAGVFFLNGVLEGGNLTEEYPLLFNFAAFFIFVFWIVSADSHKKSAQFWPYFAVGALFSASFLFRANNGGVQLVIGLAILAGGLIDRDFLATFKKLVFIGAGAILVFALVLLYFWMNHTLAEMIRGAFTYNFLDTAAADAGSKLDALNTGLGKLGLAIVPVSLGLAFSLFDLFNRIFRKITLVSDRLLIFMLISPLVEIYLSSLSGRSYGHYYICWTTIVMVLSGYGIFRAAAWLPGGAVKLLNSWMTVGAALVLALVLAWSQGIVRDYHSSLVLLLDRSKGFELFDNVSLYIRDHTQKDDRVLVWGSFAGINFMSRRDSPTAYTFYPMYPETNRMAGELSAKFLEQIQSHPPAVIVDAAQKGRRHIYSLDPGIRAAEMQDQSGYWYYKPSNLDAVLAFIDKNYDFETTIDKKYGIYRLKTQ